MTHMLIDTSGPRLYAKPTAKAPVCTPFPMVHLKRMQAIDRGTYQITSTTVRRTNPEVPTQAWVYLYESRGKRLIDAVFSDASGNYAFLNLPYRAYDIVADDPSGTYRSVIANALYPTAMP